MKVLARLGRRADVHMFNGHGLAHPYGFGLASHLGVVLGVKSIGVAKRLLRKSTLRTVEGIKTVIINDEKMGMAVETSFKPVYVSVGNLISLEDAVEVVRRCIRGSRLPEPLRRAHEIATRDRELKRREDTESHTVVHTS
jgi:deoxyribonuclease V